MKYKTLLEVKEIISEAEKNFGMYQVLDKDLNETMDFNKILEMVKRLDYDNRNWIIQKLEDLGGVGSRISEQLSDELEISQIEPVSGVGMGMGVQNAYQMMMNKFGLNS